MTYYKATRPDGTSFHDAETAWKVGRITRLEGERGDDLCGPGILHASTEPGESLVGGSWPCRLFEVEPRTKLVTDEDHPHKVGAYAWKVVRELPAHEALGPNGEAVAAQIERCNTLTADEARRLVVALDAAWGAAWDAAWGAARGAAWDAARDAAWGAAWGAAWDAAWGAAWDAARDAAWGAAWGAARDAALALLVCDLITAEQFDALYGPWASVIEGEK